jgi:hypothetical protein
MKTIYLICLVTFLFNYSLFSQLKNGYIIDNKNDTIYGYIDFEGSIKNSGHCSFKSAPDSPAQIYYPGEIKEFRFLNGKYFSTTEIIVNNKPKKVFIEWLIKGKASILSYTQLNTNVRYFILIGQDSLYELKNSSQIIEREDKTQTLTHNYVSYDRQNKEYVGTLLYYLKDCPSISGDIENMSFGSKSFIKVAKKYHEKTCPNEKCLVFEDKNRKLKFEIGGSVSYLFSQFRLNNDIPEKINTPQSTSFGIGLNISNLPVVSPKFSFSAQIIYYDLQYNYDISGLPSYLYTENRLYYVKVLRVPWQLNYNFSTKAFSPFISAGLTTNFRMKQTDYNQNLINYVTRFYDYWLGLRTFQIGFNSGLGFKYLILPKTTVSLRFEYEYANRFFGTYASDHSLNNNFFIQASVFYKLN